MVHVVRAVPGLSRGFIGSAAGRAVYSSTAVQHDRINLAPQLCDGTDCTVPQNRTTGQMTTIPSAVRFVSSSTVAREHTSTTAAVRRRHSMWRRLNDVVACYTRKVRVLYSTVRRGNGLCCVRPLTALMGRSRPPPLSATHFVTATNGGATSSTCHTRAVVPFTGAGCRATALLSVTHPTAAALKLVPDVRRQRAYCTRTAVVKLVFRS